MPCLPSLSPNDYHLSNSIEEHIDHMLIQKNMSCHYADFEKEASLMVGHHFHSIIDYY